MAELAGKIAAASPLVARARQAGLLPPDRPRQAPGLRPDQGRHDDERHDRRRPGGHLRLPGEAPSHVAAVSRPPLAAQPRRHLRGRRRRRSRPGGAVVGFGDRRLTYAALDERANRLADHLARAGIGPGDHVAAYLYNGTEFVETMLAAFKLRAAVVNVNYRYVAAELAYVLADSDARAIVYDTRFTATLAEVARLPELGARLAVGERTVTGSTPTRRRWPPASPVRPEIQPDGRRPLPALHRRHHRDARRASCGATPTSWPPASATSTAPRPGRSRRSGPGPGGDRHLPACPLMHGAAQWVTLATLLRRRDRDPLARHPPRRRPAGRAGRRRAGHDRDDHRRRRRPAAGRRRWPPGPTSTCRRCG